MDPEIHLLIQALHASARRYALVMTGGGAQAAALLLNVPGASRTILEVSVPYHEVALCSYLGQAPEQYCSVETARELARRAYERAGTFDPLSQVAGLGCTASLATDRPKRGDHRFHLALYDAFSCRTLSLTFVKGARDRLGEEAVLDRVLLNALAEHAGLAERVAIELLPGEVIEEESIEEPGLLAAFFRGRLSVLCQQTDGQLTASAGAPAVLVPGSFNPLHAGHLGLAEVAAELVGKPAAFELSVANVDKPLLSLEEVRRRLAQFQERYPVWLTRAPTFLKKSRLFPGVVFAIGVDTAQRLVAPRYYGDSEEQLAAVLAAIRDAGCRFLVAARINSAGQLETLADVAVSPAWQDLFEAIPVTRFRMDVSSTALREVLPSRARSAAE
jgi:hypothetical protein